MDSSEWFSEQRDHSRLSTPTFSPLPPLAVEPGENIIATFRHYRVLFYELILFYYLFPLQFMQKRIWEAEQKQAEFDHKEEARG